MASRLVATQVSGFGGGRDMASQFEDIADVYDRILDDAPYRRFVELPSVLAVLGDVAGLRVLDLGCVRASTRVCWPGAVLW